MAMNVLCVVAFDKGMEIYFLQFSNILIRLFCSPQNDLITMGTKIDSCSTMHL